MDTISSPWIRVGSKEKQRKQGQECRHILYYNMLLIA